MISEQDHRDMEVCEELTDKKIFQEYQDMLRRWLVKENALYLNYTNKTVTPAREDAEKREFIGALRMLDRIIKKPGILSTRIKQLRVKGKSKGKTPLTSIGG